MMEDPTYEDAAALCKRVLKAFTDGQVGELYYIAVVSACQSAV